jgi:VIT1/CCC1 family predicted Fe2+/Mn2+ transporter
VLGANDGLVSNASLVMGVAGADLAGRNILITGLAGLLAGSLSMALGEWLSVQSARELYSHQIAIERDELEAAPEEEAEELALIYQSKGLAPERAQELANSIIRDQTAALDTLAREELGVDPSELGGSAWVAAITSFVLFSIGAIVPVFPYFFGGGTSAVIVSVILSVIALFVIGAAITVITGRSVLMSGGRQVVFGMAAAAITFGVGRLIGGV